MTPIATIGRFHAAYRLPSSRAGEARRLDGVLRDALDQSLETALERAGLADGTLICIRRIHVPVRVRLSSTDSALGAAWCAQVVEAIARLVQDALRDPEREPADFESAVVYATRLRALFDMARRGGAGDLRRSWVWRRLGLWSRGAVETSSQAVAETVAAAVREPELIVPLLVLLARAGGLAEFARRVAPAQWEQLAGEIMLRAGASAGAVAWTAEPQVESAEADRIADRVVAASPLVKTWSGADLPVSAIRAIAALAVAQAEPAALLLPPERLRKAIASVALRLAKVSPGQPKRGRVPDRKEQREVDRKAGKRPTASEESRAEAAETGAEAVPYTDYGGLLFLVPVVAELGLPAAMVEAFPDRGLRWTLHQLATSLLPISAEDPAALAFCGLEPDAAAPDRGEPPASPEESERLDGWRRQLIEALAARLSQERRTVPQLLHFVCRRPARVVADPGWIELRFPMYTVSSEIRRAALDLNPGWTPWLGVVLSFVYE
jgi:hypothetical protein